MRQAGLKPKSHSSGVYWTRANARNGNAAQDAPQAISTPLVIAILLVTVLPVYTIYWVVTRSIAYMLRKIYYAITTP